MDKFNLNFGLVIAFIVPGFLGLYAASEYSDVIQKLLGGSDYIPTIGAVVPLLLLAIASGILLNALAWALIRPIIELTGVKRPEIRYGKMKKEAIESSYRYYQSYVHLFLVLLIIGIQSLVSYNLPSLPYIALFISVLAVLFIAARDSLSRSYQRMSDILNKEILMTNGDPVAEL